MRRFLRWSILSVLVLVLAVVVIVQLVLWSDLPRREVEAALERQLGLEVAFADLSTGWWGGTTISHATFALPLRGEVVLAAPRLRVRHHSLLWLGLTGKLGLSSIAVEGPAVTVREMEGGRWNLQEAWEVLQARLKRDGDGGGPARLPDVEVTGATVRVERADGGAATLAGIEARATAQRLRYVVEVAAPEVGTASVTLLAGPPFTHEAEFALRPDAAVLRALVAGAPTLAARGAWRGEWGGGALEGTLALDEAAVDDHAARGRVALSLRPGDQSLRAEPERLEVRVAGLPEAIHLAGGAIEYTGQGVRLDAVGIGAFDLSAEVTGELDPRLQTGELELGWSGRVDPAGISHRGELRAAAEVGATGRRMVRATVSAGGDSPWGAWRTAVSTEAVGAGWRELRGRTVAERFEIMRDGKRFHLDGLTAGWSVRGSRVTLERAALPLAEQPRVLEVAGFFDWAERAWEAHLSAASFALPAAPFPVDRLVVTSRGSLDVAELESIVLQTGPVQLSGRGAYAFGAEKQPLFLDVHLDKAPIRFGEQSDRTRIRVDNLSGRLEMHGRLSPLDVELGGEMLVTALTVGEDRLGEIATQVRGKLETESVRFVATAPQWLGGRWRLDANWDRPAARGRFDLTAEELDLSVAEQLLGLPVEVSGIGGLRVTIHSPAETSAGWFDAAGSLTATDASLTAATARIAADRVEGRFILDDRELVLRELRATRPDGELTGRATLSLGSGQAAGVVELRDWPVLFAGGDASIGVTGRLRAERPAAGEPVASAEVGTRWVVGGNEVGQLDVVGTVRPRRIEVDRLRGDVLGGRITGEGVVDIESYIASDFTLEWDDLQMDQLQPYVGAVEVGGVVSGSLAFESPDDPRALGPLRATMTIDAGQVSVANLPFGKGKGVAYTDGRRVVLQNLEVEAAGGTVSLWGRLTPRPRPAPAGGPGVPGAGPGDEWVVYATAGAEALDLETISKAVRPDASPVVGRLSGEVTLSSPVGDWSRSFGRGSLVLNESDLGNIPLFGSLYNLMNLQLRTLVPEGSGRSEFRIEQAVVYFPSFRYANRGFQLHFLGLRLLDLSAGADSPIAGHATVGQSILPDANFLGSINEALQNLQADLIAVRLEGTFGAPRPVPVPFQGLRDLIAAPIAGD